MDFQIIVIAVLDLHEEEHEEDTEVVLEDFDLLLKCGFNLFEYEYQENSVVIYQLLLECCL